VAPPVSARFAARATEESLDGRYALRTLVVDADRPRHLQARRLCHDRAECTHRQRRVVALAMLPRAGRRPQVRIRWRGF
jgi:hypothetical protein